MLLAPFEVLFQCPDVNSSRREKCDKLMMSPRSRIHISAYLSRPSPPPAPFATPSFNAVRAPERGGGRWTDRALMCSGVMCICSFYQGTQACRVNTPRPENTVVKVSGWKWGGKKGISSLRFKSGRGLKYFAVFMWHWCWKISFKLCSGGPYFPWSVLEPRRWSWGLSQWRSLSAPLFKSRSAISCPTLSQSFCTEQYQFNTLK